MSWVLGNMNPVAASCGKSIIRFRKKRGRIEGKCDLADSLSGKIFKRWALRREGCPDADNCPFYHGYWNKT
jgi:hypothetical protein